MDEVIDEALYNRDSEEEEPEPPIKKRKMDEPNNDGPLKLKRELKFLLSKYPTLQLDDVMKAHRDVSQLSIEELGVMIENIKIKVGLQTPNNNALSILAAISYLFERVYGKTDIYERMSHDSSLVLCIDDYCPDPTGTLGQPLQIIAKVASHITNTFFFTPTQNNKQDEGGTPH